MTEASTAPARKRAPKKEPPPFPVVMLLTEKLVPYARNARIHGDKQVNQIAASIQQFGFTNPVLVDEHGSIVAGHGRVLAAKQLGRVFVPCIVLAGLTEEQVKAYRLADNKLAEGSKWDPKLLALEVGELSLKLFDLTQAGFGVTELAKWNKVAGNTPDESDDDPPPPAVGAAVSQHGDLWLLGSHRLICGDSTVPATVLRLIEGELSPVIMVTDPPYGVSYDPAWRHRAGVNNSERLGEVQNDDRADWAEAWNLSPAGIAYVWHASSFASTVQASLEGEGFEIRAQIIWKKDRAVMSRGAYHWQHEPCWYAVRKGATSKWKGDRGQSTVWEISGRAGKQSEKADEEQTTHGTQKPVACMLRPIMNHTKEGEAVYDPFLGSGTTLIAAEKSRRVAYAVELDPRYIDMAVLRWQRFTGLDARLEGDGRTFSQIQAERLKGAAASAA